jgi:hypothetical protein
VVFIDDEFMLGFHYFNDDHDVARAVEAIAWAMRP